VVRFAQALGFSGYPELQRTVRAAQRPALGAAAAGSGRSTAGGLDTALAADRAQLDEALARVGAHGLAPLVAALSARMPLVIAGEGHARPVVALLEERLLRAGRSVLALEAADPRARVRLAGLGPSAAVLAVALGRETGLAEAAVSAARAAGVPAAVLVDTPLAGLARAPLARVVPADPRDGEPGLVAMVAVAQALAQGLAAGAARALAAVGA
jgi:DNA-binding MurR/RpiR family transcriptional regulator